MKIKTLLVAGLAAFAMGAVAQEMPTFTLQEMQEFKVGEPQTLTVTFDRKDCTQPTNWQLYIHLPEGMEALTTNSQGTQWGSLVMADFMDEEFVPAGSLSTNFLGGQDDDHPLGSMGLPEVRWVYASMTKTPIPKNPARATLKLQITDAFKGGSVMFRSMKTIHYDDSEWVSADVDFVVPFTPKSAVENVNAGKAVAGVKYYNVAGVAADKAFDGVNIVVTTYADGTQNVVKVVK